MATANISPSLLDAHKLVSEELRHTATVIWQFSIAIVTLQGGAIALTGQNGFDAALGKAVLTAAFLLSFLFSLMLVRQAYEREGFARRIKTIEADMPQIHSAFSIPITSPCLVGWFKSTILAWFLLLESIAGIGIFLCLNFGSK
jgi:hypothetical protein